MKMTKQVVSCLLILFLFSCSEEKGSMQTLQEEIPRITSFTFMPDDNGELTKAVSATVNKDKQEITVVFPPQTAVEQLAPTITISDGATISPGSKVPQDLSKPVIYTLGGEGYETVTYQLTASVQASQEAAIRKLSFLTSHNAHLAADIFTTIEGTTIKAQVSDKIDLSALVPSIQFSEGAVISPDDSQPMDFSEEVVYTVTAEDDKTKTEYSVQINSLSSNTKISAFQFNVNDVLYDAAIDHNSFEVSLALPYGTDLSALAPIIRIENTASITPASGIAQDFNTMLAYEVIAADGSKQTYRANITTLSASQNDRAVLEELYRVNKEYNLPFTYLDWDLDASTMDNWQGVTITDGRVTKLQLSTIVLHELPERIGELTELTHLTIVGTQLSELPTQLGNLQQLEALSLYDNELRAIPAEIGALKSVLSIHLQDNELIALPVEIGQMSSLVTLDVHNNKLNTLPVELADVPDLVMLNIKGNPLTAIPQVICNKKTERNSIPIIITKDDDDMCK